MLLFLLLKLLKLSLFRVVLVRLLKKEMIFLRLNEPQKQMKSTKNQVCRKQMKFFSSKKLVLMYTQSCKISVILLYTAVFLTGCTTVEPEGSLSEEYKIIMQHHSSIASMRLAALDISDIPEQPGLTDDLTQKIYVGEAKSFSIALFMRALSLSAKGEFIEADQINEQAIRLWPEHLHPYLLRCVLLDLKGETFKEYKKQLEDNPETRGLAGYILSGYFGGDVEAPEHIARHQEMYEYFVKLRSVMDTMSDIRPDQ